MNVLNVSTAPRSRRRCARAPIAVGLAFAALVAGPPSALATQAPSGPAASDTTDVDACTGPASHEFDFWPGVWEIDSRRLASDGQWVETRQMVRVETLLGGCAFIDYFEGAPSGEPMKGMGTRFWDPQEAEWVLTWMSTEDPGRLELWRGTFGENGRGEFLQTVETEDGTILSRISWYNIRGDSADWDHAISRDGGETWQRTWIMKLRKIADEAR